MTKTIKNMKDLALLIREARKKQDLTQEDLAGLSGTGRRFIIDLEKGKETVQMGKVFKTLNSLGVAFSPIIEWDA